MSRWRWVSGIGVVAALSVAAVFLTLQGDQDAVRVTTATTTLVPSTTTIAVISSTTSDPTTTTSTTTAAQRQAEVEELLQRLWFGWFDAIYRKDPDALWEVVATTQFHDAGAAAMETMEFLSEPTPDGVVITQLDILLDRSDCLVVQSAVDMTAFRGIAGEPVVNVLWLDLRYGYRFATDWQYADDLWLGDCENLEREVTP